MGKVCDVATLNPYTGSLQRIRPDSFTYHTIDSGHTVKVFDSTEYFVTETLTLVGDMVIVGTGILTLWDNQGNVLGPPAGATDNAVARYDGVTGELIQDSAVVIADDGDLTMNSGQINTVAGTTTKAAIHLTEATALKTTPVAGDLEYKGGHLYLTNGARHVVTTSAGIKTSTTTVTNTVTETEIYSYTFAANEMHEDERLKFNLTGSVTNAAASDDYIIRFKIDGVTVHTISRVGGNVTDAGWTADYSLTIRILGASGTFVDFSSFIEDDLTYASGALAEQSIDTTVSNAFSVTVQWANAKAGNLFHCTQADLSFNH